MKIVILAYYFYPDQHIAAVRPQNWATWLSEQHDVTVITRECNACSDRGFPFHILRPKSCGIRFVEWAKSLRDRFLPPKKVARGNDQGRLNQCQQPKKASGVFYARMPTVHDLWLPACYSAINKIKPDVVIATHGPYISLVAAYCYTLINPRIKLWVDYRDFWTRHHISVGVPLIKQFEQYIEHKCNELSSVISAVSKSHATKIENYSKKKVSCIYNSPLYIVSSDVNKIGVKFSIAYTGSVYSGWQDPSPLFEVINDLSRKKIITSDKLEFSIASKYPGNMLDIASYYNITEFIKFYGEISRSESISLQHASSILLLLESPSPEAQGVLTGKVFEYLATDKPILLIGPGPESELYQLLKSYDRLITLEDFRDIVENSRPLPVCTPVDFRDISKNQLFEALHSLKTQ